MLRMFRILAADSLIVLMCLTVALIAYKQTPIYLPPALLLLAASLALLFSRLAGRFTGKNVKGDTE